MTRFWNNIHQLITSNSKEWKVHVLRLVFELISWAELVYISGVHEFVPFWLGFVFFVSFFSIYRVFVLHFLLNCVLLKHVNCETYRSTFCICVNRGCMYSIRVHSGHTCINMCLWLNRINSLGSCGVVMWPRSKIQNIFILYLLLRYIQLLESSSFNQICILHSKWGFHKRLSIATSYIVLSLPHIFLLTSQHSSKRIT